MSRSPRSPSLALATLLALGLSGGTAAAASSTVECGKGRCATLDSVFNAAGQPPLRLAFSDRLPAGTIAALRRSDLAGALRGLPPGQSLELTVLVPPGADGAEAQRRIDSLAAAWTRAGLPADRLRTTSAEAPPRAAPPRPTR